MKIYSVNFLKISVYIYRTYFQSSTILRANNVKSELRMLQKNLASKFTDHE
jgi:hypothetical protein